MDPKKSGTGFRIFYPETNSYTPPSTKKAEPAKPEITPMTATPDAPAPITDPEAVCSSPEQPELEQREAVGDDRPSAEFPLGASQQKGPYYGGAGDKRHSRDIAPQQGPYGEDPHGGVGVGDAVDAVDFNTAFAGATPGPDAQLRQLHQHVPASVQRAAAAQRRVSMLEQAREVPDHDPPDLEPNLRTHMEPRRRSIGTARIKVAPPPLPPRKADGAES